MSVQGVDGQATICQKSLASAAAKFKDWATKNKGADFVSKINITYDPKTLTSGIGGCAVTGFGGKITVQNTLQSRLMLAYETRLPQLRAALFA